jgi:hypothetical protein
MKIFLKLIAAVFVFGFASANAEYTAEQKAAAIKAVTDAIATGDEEAIKAAVSKQIGSFPELAGAIVAAGLNAPGSNSAIQNLLVQVASWTAPGQLSAIEAGISQSGLSVSTIANLKGVAGRVAGFANAASAGDKRRDALPPITAS